MDTEEEVQPKQQKLVIEVTGMRGEPTMQEVLLEKLDCSESCGTCKPGN